MTTVISVENLSKSYRLGQIGTGTFAHDLNLWWAKVCGKPNPMLKIGETDYGNRDGEDLWALKDVSFTVQQGEVLGIIGRNGAGKSTLLKILSRVTAPTSGTIKVKGRIASLLEVGTGFHPELTGRENIYLNGAILGMSRREIDRKFDEIVDFAEVEKFIDTPVKRYSSGMYVRLAFAVAAHLEPEILLVDEVLAVGDAEFQKKCLGKMGDVAQEGRTVLFVSHNMIAVQSLCDKGLLLDRGKNTFSGDIQEVISDYLRKSSSNENAFIDLSNHQGRRSGSIETLEKLTLYNNNSESRYLSVGEVTKFEISMDSKEVLYPNVIVGFGIYSLLGQLLITSKSNVQSLQKLSLQGKKRVCLIWDECLLIPGLYKLGVALSYSGKVIDWVDDIQIEVKLEKDFYETGKSGSQERGLIFPKMKWEIDNE
jgi:lipopolysaccharide transport system ATP-binding protein